MADQDVKRSALSFMLFAFYASLVICTGVEQVNDLGQDNVCKKENQLVNYNNIGNIHTFSEAMHLSMALAWVGRNDEVLIIVTSKFDRLLGSTTESTVFRSTDYGKTYHKPDIKSVIKKHNGLQRNPKDPMKVYLVGEGKVLYITEDGGESFLQIDIPFLMDGEFIFHTHPDYSSYLMALDKEKVLYVSTDNGRTWQEIQSNIVTASWGIIPPYDEVQAGSDTENTIYVTVRDSGSKVPNLFDFQQSYQYTLKKSSNKGESWVNLLQNMTSYKRKGKFLITSVLKDRNNATEGKKLMVSTNGGNSFLEALLPNVEDNRFYSVIDVEDNMVFVHVDDGLYTDRGVLYTSATPGVVYSESLQRHLFPNFGETHDFYKVKSMRGVYLTSQMNEDNSIHTMITYNRGATWQKIPRPEGVPCEDETKECYLQIHGMYSVKRGIKAIPPLSEESAVGIIMAHGHVADSLKTTDPDVFVSIDGGYNWRLALKGLHDYSIGDHGNLLVAVSRVTQNPNVVKFSLDWGRCWHEYSFTDKILYYTGMLTQPNGKSTVVMIWGYDENMHWEVNVIDFADVIKNQCTELDYEEWIVHSTHRSGEGFQTQGCYLGAKESFLRLKQDAWCYNGYDHVKESSRMVCKCTREDYQCDYGYFKPEGSSACEKDPAFKGPEIDICDRGHEERFISEGYRKIPGDKCAGGFSPNSTMIDLNAECSDKTNASDSSSEEESQEFDEDSTVRYNTGTNRTLVYVNGLGYDDQDFNGAGRLSALSLTCFCLFGIISWM